MKPHCVSFISVCYTNFVKVSSRLSFDPHTHSIIFLRSFLILAATSQSTGVKLECILLTICYPGATRREVLPILTAWGCQGVL